jgi:co-chaperonin GroES (HSP10)
MITPLLHRILIKQDKLEETDTSYQKMKELGLVIPDGEDKTRKQAGVDRGTVVAIGPTAYKDFNSEVPIKIGDRIAYARYSGKIIHDPSTGEEFVALNDEDIVCLFN